MSDWPALRELGVEPQRSEDVIEDVVERLAEQVLADRRRIQRNESVLAGALSILGGEMYEGGQIDRLRAMLNEAP